MQVLPWRSVLVPQVRIVYPGAHCKSEGTKHVLFLVYKGKHVLHSVSLCPA